MNQRDWVNKWIDTWEATINYWKNNPDNLAYPPSVVKHVEHFPQKLRDAISANDIDAAITLTAKFVAITHESGWVQISKDLSNQAVKENKSTGARNAADARWNVPGWKVEKVKEEYETKKKELGPSAKNKTICRKVSELIFKTDKSWRRINRLVNRKK